MKQAYRTLNFRRDTLDVIYTANSIIAEYAAEGYLLTLRQLYYRFVAGGFIPNTEKDYKRLGTIISDGRYAGLIDWDAIEDRTRNVALNAYDEAPDFSITNLAHGYMIEKWADQPYHVEVWVEKEALAGIVSRVAWELDVPHLACKGYMSASEMRACAMRYCEKEQEGRDVVILHLGDHDPSGIDMTRDIEDRLREFCLRHGHMGPEVKRIALNMNQVRAYNPPPNPAKITDTRAKSYISRFGNESWELDALPPNDLADLIRDHVLLYRDEKRWAKAVERERREARHLRATAENWEEITEYLENRGLVEEDVVE